ncbi:hypothetical protein QBC38DRAFT_549623 [Podospora fimiseda]|uniref:Ankyrin repeat protein n=1 Tax=Podospora fimiseda TaxID=252190 RepID=A0AAN6YST8_9PEZI|nr:hypothetical protein QBC38DRAFT_549623 [Podospora fimiseda]
MSMTVSASTTKTTVRTSRQLSYSSTSAQLAQSSALNARDKSLKEFWRAVKEIRSSMPDPTTEEPAQLGKVLLALQGVSTSVIFLHVASRMGYLDAIKTAFEAIKSERRSYEIPTWFDRREDKTGNTALIMAAENGNYKVAEYLLEVGADRKWKNKDGMSARDCIKSQDDWLALLEPTHNQLLSPVMTKPELLCPSIPNLTCHDSKFKPTQPPQNPPQPNINTLSSHPTQLSHRSFTPVNGRGGSHEAPVNGSEIL